MRERAASAFDVESWRAFISEKIVPMRDEAAALLNFWAFLKSLEGRYLSEVLREHPKLEPLFLGGTKPPGEYKENSLAFAVRELLGAGVSLDAYYSLVTQGFEARTPVEVEKTAFIRFVESIRDLTAGIVGLAATKGLISGSEAGAEPQAGDIGLDADELVGRLVGFLQLCADTTVGVDPLVTFAWNVRKITRKYLNEAFPETRDEENMRLLHEILGLEEIFTPEVEDESVRKNYTVYGYPDFLSWYESPAGAGHHLGLRQCRDSSLSEATALTLGGYLLRLNARIWGLFMDNTLSQILNNVPNLRREYLIRCKNVLRGLERPLMEEMEKVTWSWCACLGSHVLHCEELDISGASYEFRGQKRPLLKLFDEIMPAVFLGLYEIVFSEDRRRFVVVRRGC